MFVLIIILVVTVHGTPTSQAVCYAHYITHLVWPSQKLYGTGFTVLHISQIKKPRPTRYAQGGHEICPSLFVRGQIGI